MATSRSLKENNLKVQDAYKQFKEYSGNVVSVIGLRTSPVYGETLKDVWQLARNRSQLAKGDWVTEAALVFASKAVYTLSEVLDDIGSEGWDTKKELVSQISHSYLSAPISTLEKTGDNIQILSTALDTQKSDSLVSRCLDAVIRTPFLGQVQFAITLNDKNYNAPGAKKRIKEYLQDTAIVLALMQAYTNHFGERENVLNEAILERAESYEIPKETFTPTRFYEVFSHIVELDVFHSKTSRETAINRRVGQILTAGKSPTPVTLPDGYIPYPLFNLLPLTKSKKILWELGLGQGTRKDLYSILGGK